MAKRVCYCLTARSPFHFGERGVGMEEASVILHSDTLFSALCLMLLELGEDLDGLLGDFPRVYFEDGNPPKALPGNSPFLLSSAFPFWARAIEKEVERVFLFPKPFLKLQRQTEADPKQAKNLKKVQFVSQSIFESWLTGKLLDFREEDLIQGKKVWVAPSEKKAMGVDRLWFEDTQPHVSVDRASSASQVYAVGRVRFVGRSGLFFLVDYIDEAWRPVLEKALRALGDSGVGGDRSSGNGQFELEILEDFSLALPENAKAFATLSLFWPSESETQSGILSKASYGLIQRRGWIGAQGGMNLRRRAVRMLTEGSVFLREPAGALVDVKPLDPEEVPNVSHDVWRYGLAFTVPCLRHAEEKDG